MSVPVWTYPKDSAGSWDMGIVHEMLGPLGEDEPWDLKQTGGVVILAGQHCVNDAEQLAKDIGEMPWCLTVVCSDEEALFPVELLPRDEHHTIWGQYHARPEFERVIPIGTPPGTTEVLAKIEATHPTRMGDVFFGGQDTHERRHELLDVMKDMACDSVRYGNLTWAATTGFREGLSQDRYLAAMRDTRIAPCPSGPHSLDSFRLYEALAAGALPVVELCTPHGDERGFWDAMFGPGNPLPQVWSWHELVDLAPYWKQGIVWGPRRDEVREWWAQYRKRLAWDFAETIDRLRQS